MGHVRDLPASASEIPARLRDKSWAKLGVNVEEEFDPIYVIPPGKRQVVKKLKEAIKDSDELFLATDEDREGESIGWHLVKVLSPKMPVRRMVFHEITKEAIQGALEKTRDIDVNLIEAQETRRVLDRLVGYTISPLLWKKIAPKLSAGRVQSVAVRLLVVREKDRIAFIPATYWGLKALLSKNNEQYEAVLTHHGGIRIANGRDFDNETGKLKRGLKDGVDVYILGEEQARTLAERLPDQKWHVSKIDDRINTRSPYAPFITSTLQQEASRKLGLSARQTMQVAQKLYEQGYITYMRTDSTNLSNEAIEASRRAVTERYGAAYLSPKPRIYTSSVRNAQEAHEAIRPAGREMKTRDELGLAGTEAALYDLIWKRTVASQMANAKIRMVSALIDSGEGAQISTFKANGRTIVFPGFFRAYVEGSDDPEAALDVRDQPLPELKEGDEPSCNNIDSTNHETKPPIRYTEAALVQVLEKEGVGRPSTYATIIETIINRGYVRKQGNQLIPTFTAFAATSLLEEQFEQLVDIGFTAEMERSLDNIADGVLKPVPYLRRFFKGEAGIEKLVEEGLDTIDARKVSTIKAPKWGQYVIRVGKFGPYVELEKDGERFTASVPEDTAPGDVTRELLNDLITARKVDDRVIGIHPEAELPILLREGPYGAYVQLGDDEQPGKPKRMTIPKGITLEQVDLEIAVSLLSLPRSLGKHPESGKIIKTSFGRFGPYVQLGSTFASLKKEDDIFTITLDRALELFSVKMAKAQALRTLGQHPKTGDVIEIWEGRYGPYLKYKKTNVSLPKDRAPEAITMEEAVELLKQKKSKRKKRGNSNK